MLRSKLKNILNIIKKNKIMLDYIRKYCPSQIFISLFQAFYSSTSALINIIYLKYVIDSLSYGNRFNEIIYFALFILLYNLMIMSISNWLTQYIGQKNMYLLSKGMLNEVFTKASSLDYQCYENTEFYSKFTIAIEQSDKRALEILSTFTDFISSILGITSFSVFISFFDPLLFIAVILNVLVSIYYSMKNSNTLHMNYTEKVYPSRKQEYSQRVFYLNIFAKELRMFDKLPNIIRENFNSAIDQLIQIAHKYARIFTKRMITQSFLSGIINFFTTIYISYKVVLRLLKISDFFTLSSCIGQLTQQISNLLRIVPRLYENSLYVDDFQQFMDYESMIKSGIISIDQINSICFKNVFFTYPNKNLEVLKNISFNINKNERIALVGPNGSGKTTIVKLIIRLYNTEQGDIILNDKSIEEYDLASYRDNIGIIFQDFQLLSLSIIENILMRPINNKEIDEKIAINALKKVGLYDKIMSLPYGLYTKYSKEYDEDGIYLSGGEMQSLAIARIYAKQCKIVILDEPSSALDPIAEKRIFDLTLQLIKDKTVILISHRLTNIKNVDRIFYMDKGEILEVGNHDELYKKKGHYYKLYETQAKNYR